MGVSIREILKDKYFKKYQVLAGETGLDREVQAVALFDAPDGYKWFKGKELVITTGYLLQDTKYFMDVLKFLHSHNSAGVGIKVDRYLKKIPEEVIQLCNEIGMPLIDIPFNEAWIDIINAVNSIAVNRFISKLIDVPETHGQVNPRYLQNKILYILSKLSNEINKPITIVQAKDNKTVTYPESYEVDQQINYHGDVEDLGFSYIREIICDKLNIIRIQAVDEDIIPWLMIPIRIRDFQVAKMIIWEEKESIDYFDLFAIRMTSTLLMEIYEQIYIFYNFEGRYYDDFIKGLISGELNSYSKIREFSQGIRRVRISLDNVYTVSVIKATQEGFNLHTYRDRIYNSVLSNLDIHKNIFGIISKVLMVVITDTKGAEADRKSIHKSLEKVLRELNECIRESDFIMGIGSEVNDVISVRRSYIEAIKALEVGQILYENVPVVAFEDLGPFGLLRLENIQKRDFGSNFDKIRPLMEDENGEGLLETLKVFLECESNYNIAAKKLFHHTNTIRYRISKIQQMCDIDLKDPVERLKTEITLRFLDLLE
ncbi:PucR family transcriptional regulator [Acidaminobacter hydrogenoformans]|uniref:Purine catabolism regulatory protein n=1 Tax=Acidaminobacter hydrogenoformans DSM 2784 TaxID=1120920 RepID=A0A1G5RWS6_9FIRM|nr:PucR family transcriptional regulator [Acidaminobacter hydrogenoformans]SCZ78575.1 purine catabolism regulatory protein [Acidaminobacter hydrogenoformans DSM 2784]